MANTNADIPYQNLLHRQLYQVYRMRDFRDELSLVPHRHDFYMLIWTTSGTGQHLIDFQPFEIIPNRVFFLRPGQLHQMQRFAQDGWLLVFEEALLHGLMRQPLSVQFPMFDYFNQHPYVELQEVEREVYASLLHLLERETDKGKPNLAVVPHYVYLLLLHAQPLYLQQHTRQELAHADLDRIRELRILIDRKYKEEHEMSFYTSALGVSPRKLNEVSRRALGRTVLQLVQERLLTEAKYLLLASPLSVKEITYTLGFSDPAYFGRFFKKHMGLSPAAYKLNHAR